jgi:hypothetical protein
MDPATTHVSRELVTLDEQGRAELAAVLRRTADAVAAIHRDSRTRGRRDPERWEVAMLAFARSRP